MDEGLLGIGVIAILSNDQTSASFSLPFGRGDEKVGFGVVGLVQAGTGLIFVCEHDSLEVWHSFDGFE